MIDKRERQEQNISIYDEKKSTLTNFWVDKEETKERGIKRSNEVSKGLSNRMNVTGCFVIGVQ